MIEQNDIKDTLERLENKLVKIGVFGTFSAGKSSLINALLGGQYLVSSPNPTTALRLNYLTVRIVKSHLKLKNNY